MKLSQISVRAKLAILLLVAMALLAGTRGFGLFQLGAYLDRMNTYTVALDELHQQLQAVQETHLADTRAGRADRAKTDAYALQVRDFRARLLAKRTEAEAMQQRERSIMYSTYVSMLVVVIVVGAGIYWLMMALVVRPLQGMTTVANLVAAGDLTTDIEVKSQDEIGAVLTALRNMNDGLSALIGKIRTVSHSIGTSTEQISTTSERLSRHIEGQADFLRETASSLRGLASAVSTNAENADRARELAGSARNVATRGGAEVGTALQTISSISANSQRIGDIVAIIDGITFQTNILALNAAVEAARAGAQGRGFAVVAAEVRSLAQRSATAAKEIAGLINESARELRESSGVVTNAGATMTQIVDGARAVDDIMAKMAADAAQQRQVIEKVRATVDKVDRSTQQQAMLANAAETAESMRQQALDLIAAVSVFRLSDKVMAGVPTRYLPPA